MTATQTSRWPSQAEADRALRQDTTVTVYGAARVLGIGEAAVRRGVVDGAIPAVQLGRNLRIPTAPLRRMLGIED